MWIACWWMREVVGVQAGESIAAGAAAAERVGDPGEDPCCGIEAVKPGARWLGGRGG